MEGRVADPGLLDELELPLQVGAGGQEDQALGRTLPLGARLGIGPAPAQDPVAADVIWRLEVVRYQAVPRIRAPDMGPQGAGEAPRVQGGVEEVVGHVGFSRLPVGIENHRRPIPPSPHHLRGDPVSVHLGSASLFRQGVRRLPGVVDEARHILFQLAHHQEGPVAAEIVVCRRARLQAKGRIAPVGLSADRGEDIQRVEGAWDLAGRGQAAPHVGVAQQDFSG